MPPAGLPSPCARRRSVHPAVKGWPGPPPGHPARMQASRITGYSASGTRKAGYRCPWQPAHWGTEPRGRGWAGYRGMQISQNATRAHDASMKVVDQGIGQVVHGRDRAGLGATVAACGPRCHKDYVAPRVLPGAGRMEREPAGPSMTCGSAFSRRPSAAVRRRRTDSFLAVSVVPRRRKAPHRHA